jgi:hypothetical protein
MISSSPYTIARVPAPISTPAGLDLDTRMKMISERLDSTYVTGGDEEVLIRLVEGVPPSQSVEFLRRLAERRPNGHTWFEDLDRRIDGENNQRLHEALSHQRLRAAPERAAVALSDAPVLPWHDVMGFFEDAATFAAERSSPGRVRVRYLGGVRLLTSREFGDEIAKLPFNIFVGGQEYSDDQPLIIHDYDSGRFVTVVAGELAGYEHLGVRNFLVHVATVASLVTPVSAARTVAGRVAVIALERVLPAVFLLIDENRRNILRWFPRWGPQMIRYADTVKAGVAAIGIARMAISGFQIFRQWKAIRNARRALEGTAQFDAEAQRLATALEHDADATIAQAEAIHAAETTPAAPSAVPTKGDPKVLPARAAESTLPPVAGETTSTAPPSGSKVASEPTAPSEGKMPSESAVQPPHETTSTLPPAAEPTVSEPVSAATHEHPGTTEPTAPSMTPLQETTQAPKMIEGTPEPGAAGSLEHKAARWAEYQARTGEKGLTYEKWRNVYEANMQNARRANKATDAYHKTLGWGRREVTVDVEGVPRRLDIADEATLRGIEHKTGKQYLSEGNKWELARDEILVKLGWDITWVFEGTASKPLLAALEAAKIKHLP